MRGVMRRLLVTAAVALGALTTASTAHASTLANWDRHEQRAVAHAGVLAPLPGGFHGERALTRGQLEAALSVIGTGRAASVPDKTITVALFHKLVVRQLGL